MANNKDVMPDSLKAEQSYLWFQLLALAEKLKNKASEQSYLIFYAQLKEFAQGRIENLLNAKVFDFQPAKPTKALSEFTPEEVQALKALASKILQSTGGGIQKDEGDAKEGVVFEQSIKEEKRPARKIREKKPTNKPLDTADKSATTPATSNKIDPKTLPGYIPPSTSGFIPPPEHFNRGPSVFGAGDFSPAFLSDIIAGQINK